MEKRCVIPGTFDPITLGHVDMVERASRLFEEVVLLFLVNPQKKCMFDLSDRLAMAQKSVKGLPRVRVETYGGLLNDYCAEHGVRVVIRGLRNSSDFDYEMLYFTANHAINPGLEMLFLPTVTDHLHISSSLTRELINYGGELKGFVPDCIIPDIQRLTSRKGN